MPKIGELRNDKEVGKSGTGKCMWVACPICHKERWTRTRKGAPWRLRCADCARKARGNRERGVNSCHWKGGRHKIGKYTMVWVSRDDFFYPMAHYNGYILEHRLIMAKHLGRCLHRWELVHHKNGNKDDNRMENLQLITDERHKQITILEARISFLEGKLKELGWNGK